MFTVHNECHIENIVTSGCFDIPVIQYDKLYKVHLQHD